MNDRTNQVWYLKNRTSFLLVSLCIFVLLFANISSAQSSSNRTSFYFSSKDLSAAELLLSAGKTINKPFNFIEQKLPIGKFTFSFKGTEPEFLTIISDVINRRVIPLGDSLIAVQVNVKNEGLIQTIIPSYKNQVVDSEGMPLIGCNIWSPKLKRGAQSNEFGEFELKGFFAASEIFSISYIGYEELLLPYERLIKKESIILSSKSHELGEIIVTEYVPPMESGLEKMEMATDKIAAVGAGDQDALALAQLMPGVFNSAESLNYLQIRGGPPDQVSYRWNNIQVYQNSLFYGHIAAVNPFMTEKVSVSKNGASAKEQSNASGNISMSNNLNAIDTTQIKLHADFLYTNVGLSTSLLNQKLKIQSAWRKSVPQNLRGKVYDNIFNSIFQYGKVPDLDYYFQKYNLEGIIRWENDFSFSDFSASAQLEILPKLFFQVDYLNYGNTYDLRRIHTYEEAIESDILNLNSLGISGTLDYQWNEHFSSTLKAVKSDYKFDFKFLEDRENPDDINRDQRNTVLSQSISLDNQFENEWLRLNIGYTREHWDANHVDLLLDTVYYQDGKKSFEDVAYIESKISFSQKLELDAGLKVSKYNRALNGALYWEPRLHLSYFLTPALAAHAHYGAYHQVLTKRTGYSPLLLENDFWHLSDQRFTTTNWINVIQNKQWSGGLDFKKARWHLSFDIYQKEIKNIWTASLDFSIEEDPFRFADMSVKGVELSASYQRKWLLALLTYEYVDEMVQVYDFPEAINSPFSQPHRFSAFVNVRKKGFDIFAKWQFASGRYYSFPTALDYFENEFGNYWELQYDQGFLNRQIQNYHRLDAGISYKFQFSNPKVPSTKVGLNFINLYNYDNLIKNQYFIDYKEDIPKINLLERRGLPFTWNLSLDLVF